MNKVAIDRDGHLAYDEFNCTTPWKPAETVVLVHGFTKNRLFWHDWIPELCKTDGDKWRGPEGSTSNHAAATSAQSTRDKTLAADLSLPG